VQPQPSGCSDSRGNRTERVNGIFLEESNRTRLAIVADLRRDHGIGGLILGGSEIPRILHAGDAPGVPFRGTTRTRAHRSVRERLR
jgi:aspartate/glutamate racemase